MVYFLLDLAFKITLMTKLLIIVIKTLLNYLEIQCISLSIKINLDRRRKDKVKKLQSMDLLTNLIEY